MSDWETRSQNKATVGWSLAAGSLAVAAFTLFPRSCRDGGGSTASVNEVGAVDLLEARDGLEGEPVEALPPSTDFTERTSLEDVHFPTMQQHNTDERTEVTTSPRQLDGIEILRGIKAVLDSGENSSSDYWTCLTSNVLDFVSGFVSESDLVRLTIPKELIVSQYYQRADDFLAHILIDRRPEGLEPASWGATLVETLGEEFSEHSFFMYRLVESLVLVQSRQGSYDLLQPILEAAASHPRLSTWQGDFAVIERSILGRPGVVSEKLPETERDRLTPLQLDYLEFQGTFPEYVDGFLRPKIREHLYPDGTGVIAPSPRPGLPERLSLDIEIEIGIRADKLDKMTEAELEQLVLMRGSSYHPGKISEILSFVRSTSRYANFPASSAQELLPESFYGQFEYDGEVKGHFVLVDSRREERAWEVGQSEKSGSGLQRVKSISAQGVYSVNRFLDWVDLQLDICGEGGVERVREVLQETTSHDTNGEGLTDSMERTKIRQILDGLMGKGLATYSDWSLVNLTLGDSAGDNHAHSMNILSKQDPEAYHQFFRDERFSPLLQLHTVLSSIYSVGNSMKRVTQSGRSSLLESALESGSDLVQLVTLAHFDPKNNAPLFSLLQEQSPNVELEHDGRPIIAAFALLKLLEGEEDLGNLLPAIPEDLKPVLIQLAHSHERSDSPAEALRRLALSRFEALRMEAEDDVRTSGKMRADFRSNWQPKLLATGELLAGFEDAFPHATIDSEAHRIRREKADRLFSELCQKLAE